MTTRPQPGAPEGPAAGVPASDGPAPGELAPGSLPAEPVLSAAQEADRVAVDVPYGLTVAAAWSWRILLVLAMAGAGIWLLSHVSILVIPLIIAALLATLLSPIHRRFVRWGVPRGLSAVS